MYSNSRTIIRKGEVKVKKKMDRLYS